MQQHELKRIGSEYFQQKVNENGLDLSDISIGAND